MDSLTSAFGQLLGQTSQNRRMQRQIERQRQELMENVYIYNPAQYFNTRGLSMDATGIMIHGDSGTIQPTASKPAPPEDIDVRRPVGTVPEAPAPPDEEWLALMQQLKIVVPSGICKPLASFLQQEEIVCYPWADVFAWLQKIAHAKNLAEPEIGKSGKPYRPMTGKLLFEGETKRGDESASPHYTDPIPKEVLSVAAKLRAQFPQVQFEVLYVRAGDPFLRAKLGEEAHIVAMWDEPGFTLAK
jgi:hypothetical protein